MSSKKYSVRKFFKENKSVFARDIFRRKKKIKKIYLFLISLAEQCYFNEYVYETSVRENILIKKLKKKS